MKTNNLFLKVLPKLFSVSICGFEVMANKSKWPSPSHRAFCGSAGAYLGRRPAGWFYAHCSTARNSPPHKTNINKDTRMAG